MKNNPAYSGQKPVEPMASMTSDEPMQSIHRRSRADIDETEVDMEVAPLLHSEMQKVHGRTRCQTCAIVTQTVLLTCIGLVIIAGVLVINWRFATLNEELASIAVTGELARPLLESADQLTGNFNNLTGSLNNDLGLGLTGNDSLASGVRDFTSTIADAGRSLIDGLTSSLSNIGDDGSNNDTTTAAPPPPSNTEQTTPP